MHVHIIIVSIHLVCIGNRMTTELREHGYQPQDEINVSIFKQSASLFELAKQTTNSALPL